MRWYRCKCGSFTSFGSDSPAQCDYCPKCGSNLASSPSLHRDPLPHKFEYIEEVETDEGTKTLTSCIYCYRTRKQIELDNAT